MTAVLPALLSVLLGAAPSNAKTSTAKTNERDTRTSEPFYKVLDELLLDATSELEKLSDLSPIAVGGVTVSANLSDELNGALLMRLQEVIGKLPGVKQVVCAECFAVHSEIKGGQWIVTRGIVDREGYRRLGAELGVKTFLLAGLEYQEGDDETLALTIRVIAASSGTVLAARRILSSETSSALARDNRRGRKTDNERRDELARLLRGQPRYAHNVYLGYWFLPIAFFDRPAGAPIFGASAITLAYRLYESFGPQNALLYGFQLNFLIVPEKPIVAGGALSAVFGGTIAFDNTLIPRIRLVGLAGAFIAGAYGNTFVGGGQLEIITRIGVAATAGVQGFVTSLGTNGQVGGFGYTFGANYVFE